MPAIHLVIKGKVQGVYFRASAGALAESLGLTGWIKNTPDGDVEAMASGSQSALKAFTDWCGKGPDGAKVESVEVSESSGQNFTGFAILR